MPLVLAFPDTPESVWMSFCGDELVLKKEAVDIVNQSFPRTFMDQPAASTAKN